MTALITAKRHNLTWKQSLKSYKPDVTYCKGIFGNGLKIEDDWKERERERQTCTQERILKRLKPEKKAIFFCIVGNESKSRTYYLKISCCICSWKIFLLFNL